MIEDWFKKKLNVPENWDKYDFEAHRYSFNDMVDFAEQYHNEQCDKAAVVGRSEQLVCDCGNKLTDKEVYFGQCLQCDRNVEE